jgi:DNA-binding LytR/AlgR family response regulator
MKIRVEENKNIEETEVIIKCKNNDDEVKEIYKAIKYFDKKIVGKIDGRMFSLTPNKILYFESVDNKVFACTNEQTYDVNLKLYQLEEQLNDSPFLRINKNTIVNTNKIKSFKSTINGRMEALLISNERLKISRMYVPELKKMIGGKH